ncbi:DUF5131 family protein [Sphingomonas sp.]|uniref:DUF5131 family protein n=1 Tax=Sphingomonas sp. TaxID=28214 RepID=UPI0025DF43AF|nr:DUF5131 family protein [Sphingomonas sp.]
MAEKTKIQWTSHTFNPWRGCSKVNDGCTNCYAEKEAKRFPKNRGIWGPNGTRVKAAAATWAEPLKWNAMAQAAGERRRVFCASLADVFEEWDGRIHDHEGRILHRCASCGSNWAEGEAVPCECGRDHPVNWLTMNEMRRDLFALIDRTPWLDWQLVTKRPERVYACWPPVIYRNDKGTEIFVGPASERKTSFLHRPNAWVLTSVSDQKTYDAFKPRLLQLRALAAVLGVSVEPMLAPIHFGDLAGIDWLIFGGESGPHARPCNLGWIRDGLEQCADGNVAGFMKQAGAFPLVSIDDEVLTEWALSREHLQHAHVIEVYLRDSKGGDLAELPASLAVRQFPTMREAVLS